MKTTAIRNVLKSFCAEEDLRKWFDPLQISLNQTTLTVVFPHIFFLNMFMASYKKDFETAVATCFDHEIHTAYTLPNTTAPRETVHNAIRPAVADTKCDPAFTFDTFLVNHKNYFPLASAREVVAAKEAIYNPFVMFGASGSGKTHLCKAIVNELALTHDREKIFFGTFEDLRKIYAQTNKKTDRDSLHILCSYEVLIVDDFHEMQSFPDMQHDFLSLFNAFHDQKKQIILTTSERIGGMDFLERCLKSRLEWGLMVTLKRPDLDVRLQFVQTRCKIKNIDLTTEQMLTLAQHFSDFRSLQGSLLKTLAFQKLVSPQMEHKDFQNILQGLESPTTVEITPDLIISVVSEHMSVRKSDLFSTKRHHSIVLARQVAMYFCRKLLKYSFPQIGSVFNGKDHSTVIYACKKIEKLKRENREIKELLHVISKKCYAAEKQPEI